jgi:hypothetical protein
MDRPTLRTALPAAEPGRSLLPLDLELDYEDDSIYGLSYRARVGAVVTDRVAREADLAVAVEAPAKVGRS